MRKGRDSLPPGWARCSTLCQNTQNGASICAKVHHDTILHRCPHLCFCLTGKPEACRLAAGGKSIVKLNGNRPDTMDEWSRHNGSLLLVPSQTSNSSIQPQYITSVFPKASFCGLLAISLPLLPGSYTRVVGNQ